MSIGPGLLPMPLLRLSAGIQYLLFKQPSTKVAMFHIGRCGSQALAGMLSQNPNTHWGGEVFEQVPEKYRHFTPGLADSKTVLSGVVTRANRPIFGFETKAIHLESHCINASLDSYLNMLRTMGFNRYVVLKRANFLRVVTSTLLGMQTGRWAVRVESSAPRQKVVICPQDPWKNGSSDLVQTLDYYSEFYAKLEATLGSEALYLNYETDMEQNPHQAYEKLRNYLDLPVANPKVHLKRMNPTALSELVQNYEEVCSTLRGTPHEWMLAG